MTVAVSVILPTYNVKHFLAEAIASVRAQTFQDWELVVVDDGSTDGTVEYLTSIGEPRLRLIRSAHIGNPGALRNRAVADSQGELIAFIDSDDLWEPTKLDRQIEALAADPRSAWCYSATTPMDEHGGHLRRPEAWMWKPYGGRILPELLRLEAKVPASSVVVRRNAFEIVGGFDPDAGPVEDYDLWFRLASRYSAVVIDDRLCRSRVRPDAYQADRVAANRAWQRAFRRVLASSTEPAVRSICREKIRRHRLTEAVHEAKGGRRGRAAVLLAQSVPSSLLRPAAWRPCLKVMAAITTPRRESDRR